MNPAEMIVAIIVVVMVARVLRDRYRYGVGQRAAAPSEDTVLLAQEVRQLKDRVQVLERVITDSHSSVDLDRQIERLRDR